MNLSQLLQEVYGDLGMSEAFRATGGSTTTIVDSNLSSLPNQPDDDFAINYTAFVIRDAGGASAAPEGEFARVSAYASGTWTYTVDTLTAAVGSGDDIMLCTDDIPLRDMIRAANRGLMEIGVVPNVPDTSLTTAADQTEYTLPASIQKGIIKSVWYQGLTNDADNNQWILINPVKTEQGTYGSTGTLILPQLPADRTLKIVYDGVHSKLTAYNSEIASSIPESLAIASAVKQALKWYVGNNEGGEDWWLKRYNEAALDFENEKRRLRSGMKQILGMPHWSSPVQEDTFTVPSA
jgi:hypothetical protein